MKNPIPKIKKKIASFVKDEKGSITKQNILTMGTIVSSATLISIVNSRDAEAGAVTVTTSDNANWGTSTVSHAHHANHGSHSSHASHSSGY